MLFSAITLIGCSSDDDNGNSNSGSQDDDVAVTLDNSINDFTWKAMNSWYNWQESTPALADSKDDDTHDYYTYLNNYDTPQDLFASLLNDADDFSWFIEDYEVQQAAFQGVSTTFGFRPSLVLVPGTDYVIMYIQHVSEGSPADLAGFKRGDIINAINGTVMTIDNYSTVLDGYYDTTAEFSFTETDGLTIKESITITQAVVEDNPVYLTKTFDIDGKKVGYMVYNGFRSSYNDELNAAFGELKSAGINELVLDLRINGGGSVLTSAFLASMIHDQADEQTVFGALVYNSKHSDEDVAVPFFNDLYVYDDNGNYAGYTEPINRLSGITKLYVLASGSTASASEMIINGLRPFIDVVVVGTTTTGKNEGSITLYDSPSSDYTDVDSANSSHKMAMQPIVFQIYNNQGESDYSDGFAPNILVEEWGYWNNILPFGDENEVVLKAALDDIRGYSAKSSVSKTTAKKIAKELTINKFEKEMYLDSNLFK